MVIQGSKSPLDKKPPTVTAQEIQCYLLKIFDHSKTNHKQAIAKDTFIDEIYDRIVKAGKVNFSWTNLALLVQKYPQV